MKGKLRNLSILTLVITTLGFSSITYASVEQQNIEVYDNTSTIDNVGVGSSIIILEDNFISEKPIFKKAFDEMYYNAFGEGFKFIHNYSRQVNRSVYQDGLHMKILSTITIGQRISSDSNQKIHKSYTFFTLQDKTGDRVSEDMEINLNTNGLENVQANVLMVDFDEETKIATFMSTHRFWGIEEGNNNNHKNIIIDIHDIITDVIEVNEILKDTNIYQLLQVHNPTFTQNQVILSRTAKLTETFLNINNINNNYTLLKDELSIPIEGWNSTYISNIGLKENILHIQINVDIEQNRFIWSCPINNLVDNITGDSISSIYNLVLYNYDEDWNIIGNREYREIAFYLEDISNLYNYYISLIGRYNNTIPNTGPKISFYSPIIEDNFIIKGEIPVLIGEQEVYVSNILISPLGVSFNIGEDGIFTEDDFLFIAENTSLNLIYEDGSKHENAQKRWGSTSWEFKWYWNPTEDSNHDGIVSNISMKANNIVNTKKLVAISINDVVIKVK